MKLYNIAASRMKETDRSKTIAQELRKMGAHIDEEEDNDHRIVMATTCAALGAEGPSFIDSVDHVGVSFPRFYEEMKGIGADIIRLAEK